MANEKTTLKYFIENQPLLEKKKKKKAKRKKKRRGGGLADSWFTHGGIGHGGSGMSTGGGDGGGGGGESVTFKPLSNRETLIMELLAGVTPSAFTANINSATAYSKNSNKKDAGMTTYPSADDGWDDDEEEAEQSVNKVDKARQLFQSMYNQKNMTRTLIINSFMKDVDLSNSSAVSYYTRFLKEFGISSDADDNVPLGQGSGMGEIEGGNAGNNDNEQNSDMLPDEEEMDDSEIDKSDRAGIIRTVDNAHLIYKRQESDGKFTELWIYNLHDSVNTEMKVRRDILAGTDIPIKKTKSPDGEQYYVITTMGNAQLLQIHNLNN